MIHSVPVTDGHSELICSVFQNIFKIHGGIKVCFVYVLDLVNLLALFQFLDDFCYTRSMKRVALEGCVQIAFDHGFESCLNRVKAYYDDVAVRATGLACCVDRIDCAKCLVIVLTDNNVDIRVTL